MNTSKIAAVVAATSAGLAAALATSFLGLPSPSPTACTVTTRVLTSPFGGDGEVQAGGEVQAKAVNARGDVVGFAADPKAGGQRAILWEGGESGSAVDLGVLPGYVSSEAYGVNNDRVVIGVLYDTKDRTFPFRWEGGSMTVLKGPDGRRYQMEVIRNAINEHGQIAGTLLIGGQRQAVRWSPEGRAALLGTLPGHAWSNAFGINDDGLVSGWSRQQPEDGAEENPVVWPKPGQVVPLQTAPHRADGIAEQTTRSGLTVGYLGTSDGEEVDEAVIWASRSAEPRMLAGVTAADTYGELVDVNNRGQAAGMSGSFAESGLPLVTPAVWKPGWNGLRALPVPTAVPRSRVMTTELVDINASGVIVGNVYGLDAPDFPALLRIDPVVWTCAFGR